MNKQKLNFLAAGIGVVLIICGVFFFKDNKIVINQDMATKIEKNITNYFDNMAALIKNDDFHFATADGQKIQVLPNETYYQVTFPEVTSDIGSIQIISAPYNVMLVPLDAGSQKFSVTSTDQFSWKGFEKAEQSDIPLFDVESAAQSFEGVWSNDIQNFEKFHGAIKDLSIDIINDGHIIVSDIIVDSSILEKDKLWELQETITIQNSNIDDKNKKRIFSVESTTVNRDVKSPVKSKFSILENIKPLSYYFTDMDNDDVNIAQMLDMFKNVQSISENIEISGISSEIMDFQAKKMMLSYQGIANNKFGDWQVSYAHENAEFIEEFPILNNAALDMTFVNIPLEALNTILSQIEGNYKEEIKKILSQEETINYFREIMNNKTALRIDNIAIGSPDSYQIQLKGDLLYSKEAALGVSGKFSLDLIGMHKFVEDNPNLGLQGFVGVLALYGEKQGEADAYHYDIKIESEGAATVNGKEIEGLQQMLMGL